MKITSYQDNLKQSKRTEFSKLPDVLLLKAAKVAERFEHPDVHLVCVDESIVNRTEFSINLPSNRRLAYVGDAFLALQLAQQAFEKQLTPEDYQKWRGVCLSDKYLARVYDELFPKDDVIVHFNDTLSVKQKATFIEALVGLLKSDELVKLIIK